MESTAALSAAILSFFPTKYDAAKAAFEVTSINLSINFLSIAIKLFHLLNLLVLFWIQILLNASTH